MTTSTADIASNMLLEKLTYTQGGPLEKAHDLNEYFVRASIDKRQFDNKSFRHIQKGLKELLDEAKGEVNTAKAELNKLSDTVPAPDREAVRQAEAAARGHYESLKIMIKKGYNIDDNHEVTLDDDKKTLYNNFFDETTKAKIEWDDVLGLVASASTGLTLSVGLYALALMMIGRRCASLSSIDKAASAIKASASSDVGPDEPGAGAGFKAAPTPTTTPTTTADAGAKPAAPPAGTATTTTPTTTTPAAGGHTAVATEPAVTSTTATTKAAMPATRAGQVVAEAGPAAGPAAGTGTSVG